MYISICEINEIITFIKVWKCHYNSAFQKEKVKSRYLLQMIDYRFQRHKTTPPNACVLLSHITALISTGFHLLFCISASISIKIAQIWIKETI